MALLALGLAYWDERRSRTRDAAKHADAMEKLLREDRPILKKMIRVLAINSEVLRGHKLTESELGEVSDETPEDPLPLPLTPREKEGAP